MYGLLANKYCHKVKSYVSFLIPMTPLTKIETKQAFPGSALAFFLGCQDSCGLVRNESTSSLVSSNIRQGLKFWHMALTTTLNVLLLCSN